MAYRFTADKSNYSLFSPGGVFYSLPGHPAFPVRLASEIFQACAAHLAAFECIPPYHLYDPCCGGAYHLATLGYLHPEELAKISASDIDGDAVGLAERNLSLLTPAGLEQRRLQIEQFIAQYGKESHRQALLQSQVLADLLRLGPQIQEIHTFQADALSVDAILSGLDGRRPDLVITDIPYGSQSAWVDTSANPAGQTHAARLLETLHQIIAERAVVAVAADKSQKIAHPAFRQLRRMKIGHRQVVFLAHN
jgi:hypothetical protein